MPHTPGPWEVNLLNGTKGGICIRAYDPKDYFSFELATIWGEDNDWEHTEMAIANAQIISTAPDLLAEIEKQIQWLKYIKDKIGATDAIMIGFDQSIKYLSKVAAKARGK